MPKKTLKNKNKNISHQLFLGVDGGGTKTHIIILDKDKNLVCEGSAGPSNPLRVGIETSVINILEAVNSACDKVNKNSSDIVSATLGLAGVRRADIKASIRQRFTEFLPIEEIQVVTDAEIALFGTTLGKAGLVIISGTGSICLGRDEKGNFATAGGWGPIAGDEGGGIGIAKQGLQAIAKALDGRGGATKLSSVGTEYFRASTPDDLIVAIYSPQTDNKKIAGFAKCVVETAKQGDEIAIEILAVAGYELGIAALAVIKKLNLQNQHIPIGMVGSIFKAGDLLTKPLLQIVNSVAPKAFLQKPELNPAKAAAFMAIQNFQSRY